MRIRPFITSQQSGRSLEIVSATYDRAACLHDIVFNTKAGACSHQDTNITTMAPSKTYNPQTDIPDLSRKVIFITGGMSSQIKVVCLSKLNPN